MNLLLTKDCEIEGYKLPNFSICEGQMVAIFTPLVGLEQLILQNKIKGLNISKPLCYVDSNFKSDGNLLHRLIRATIKDYVSKYSNVLDKDVEGLFEKLNIQPDTLPKYLSHFQRLIINLTIGFSNTNFILVNSSGLSPQSVIEMYQYLYIKIQEDKQRSVVIIENPHSERFINNFEVYFINEDNLHSVIFK